MNLFEFVFLSNSPKVWSKIYNSLLGAFHCIQVNWLKQTNFQTLIVVKVLNAFNKSDQ
jgi:hypothetical protein